MRAPITSNTTLDSREYQQVIGDLDQARTVYHDRARRVGNMG